MKRIIGSLVALSVIAAVLVVVFWRRPLNVLIITIDTLRADRLHCYGYKKEQTPNLDRLAAEGALFENAFCDVTWTVPSLASRLTGTYATVHGLKSTYERLDGHNRTLAEMLHNHGYQTAAVVGSFPASSIFGLNQGFEFYDEQFDTPIVAHGDGTEKEVPLEFHENIEQQRDFQKRKAEADAYRPDNEVTDAALRWLNAHYQRPFHLWVHYFGPHEKVDARTRFFDQVNDSIAAYDTDVATSDREVGRLLDAFRALKILDNTVVVVHADHGQSLNEHDYFGHGRFLYDEVLRVPLLIRDPRRFKPGTRITRLARIIDIVPTVLDAINVHERITWQGRSLLRLPAEGMTTGDDVDETYCETYLSATEGFADNVPDGKDWRRLGFRRLGVRTPQWMFIRNEPWPFLDVANAPPIENAVHDKFTSEELYNMIDDPHQTTNLINRESAVTTQMRTRLLSYLALETTPRPHTELDPASRERMRSLGYME